jgi:CheY-like chemotaxis protein
MENTSTSPIKVLLVEDNLESAFLTRSHLEENGNQVFHVEWSANLTQGMSRLAKPGIDVVVLDLGLPELNGHICFRAIASMVGRTLPIVILTSDDRAISRERTVGFGTTRYLLKNQASPAEIRQAVRDSVPSRKTT